MRKKLLLLVVVFTFMLNGLSAFAMESKYIVLDSIEGVDLQEHKQESDMLVTLGEQVSKRRATTVLSNFRNLQQGDSRWKNEIMQSEGKTIGQAGCCLTSFTMIQQYYGGTDTPAQVNSKMGSSACPFMYAVAASKYGYTYNLVSSVSSHAYATNYIKGAISSGNPVLVGMTTSSGTHFVVAYGFDGDNIIISDPAARNYQTLSQYINSGYTVHRLCTYFD